MSPSGEGPGQDSVSLLLIGLSILGVGVFAAFSTWLVALALVMACAYGTVGWFAFEMSGIRMPMSYRVVVAGVAAGLLPVIGGAVGLGAGGAIARDLAFGVAAGGSCLVALTALLTLAISGARSRPEKPRPPQRRPYSRSDDLILRRMRTVALTAVLLGVVLVLVVWATDGPTWLLAVVAVGAMLSLSGYRQVAHLERASARADGDTFS
jgi:hypothetical protein